LYHHVVVHDDVDDPNLSGFLGNFLKFPFCEGTGFNEKRIEAQWFRMEFDEIFDDRK